MKFKGLLFDLDGTVLDTSDLIVQSFQYTFQKNCHRQLTPSEIYAFFGRPLRDAMEFYAPDQVEVLVKDYRDYNWSHHDELISPFPEVAETLLKLTQAGLRLGIVTSKLSRTALRGLKLFQLDSYFEVIIGVEECENHKPHPEPVQRALAELNLEATDCLMIGDSPFDLQSGKTAGTKTAAVTWTRLPWTELAAEKPDFICEKFSDLVQIAGILTNKTE